MKTRKLIFLNIFFACFFPFYCSSDATAQNDDDIAELNDSDKEIKKHFEPSYITFGGGYDSERKIASDDLYYEAQIYAHLYWLRNKIVPETNHIFRLYMPIRLQVRQYNTESSPVKTPGYNPGLRLYYWNRYLVNKSTDFHYFSGGFHHYSNGQSGPHFDPNSGLVNTEKGSFSSDYIELSYYRVNYDTLFDWKKLNVRAYLTGLTWEEPQTDFYENILLELSGKKIFKTREKFNIDMYLQMTLGYKFGRKFVSPGVDASTGDNLQYTVEWSMRPKFSTTKFWDWEDLSLYIRWDKGYDYYNINYQSKINRIQFGLVSKVF